MDHKFISCPDCNGHGHINGGDDHSSWSRTCDRCHGTGYTMVPMTNADRIRAMTDEELAEFMDKDYPFCKSLPECAALLDTEEGIPDEMCRKCQLEWLRKPADDTLPHSRIFEDKQESGLIEED